MNAHYLYFHLQISLNEQGTYLTVQKRRSEGERREDNKGTKERGRGERGRERRSERERERGRGERFARGSGVLNGSWHGHAAPRVEWQRDSLSARLGSCALLLPPLRETHDKVHVHINKPFRSAFLGSMMIAERCAEAFPDR